MDHTLPQTSIPRFSTMPICLAVLLSAMLFLILPIGQAFNEAPEDIVEVRSVVVVPPPPPPLELPDVVELVQQTRPVEIQQPSEAASIDVQPLLLSFTPSAQDALQLNVSIGDFDTHIDVVSQIKEVFAFDEIDQVPKVIFMPPVSFPRRLIRLGVSSGTVELLVLIDQEGSVTVEQVLSSTHSKLEPLAVRMAEGARFTITKVNGNAVSVRGKWPVTLNNE